jgi:hypothetical protein
MQVLTRLPGDVAIAIPDVRFGEQERSSIEAGPNPARRDPIGAARGIAVSALLGVALWVLVLEAITQF